MNEDTTEQRTSDKWFAYLQLIRAPNVFTALADVMMGHVFVSGGFSPVARFLPIALASASLYSAGMVLNDLCDLEVDRRERPDRPLPSGRVPLAAARNLAWILFGAGWLLTVVAGWLIPSGDGVRWLPGAVGTALVVAIVAYDIGLKETIGGPVVMGLCRTLNVLLGMSLAPLDESARWLGVWGPAHACVAAGIGIYVMGLTWFGRDEAGKNERWRLVTGVAIMIVGWIVTAQFPDYLPLDSESPIPSSGAWYLLLLLLGAPLLRRCWFAIQSLDAKRVRLAMGQGIWTIIWLDAAVVVAVGPPIHALALVALFIPMLLLIWRVYVT